MTRAVTEFGAADARAVLARFRPPGDEQLDDDTSSADDERSVATDDAPAAEPLPREATSEADRAVIVRRYVEAAQRKVYRRTFTPQQAARGGTDLDAGGEPEPAAERPLLVVEHGDEPGLAASRV